MTKLELARTILATFVVATVVNLVLFGYPLFESIIKASTIALIVTVSEYIFRRYFDNEKDIEENANILESIDSAKRTSKK